ncbi:MAG: K(+)-transporting ATPase subunit F [Bacteroidia bacterium]|nr:K(+)-transporting ATPase subunit F [Bacteroidia bacterium]
MIATISSGLSRSIETNLPSGYIIGAFIALILLVYLIYSLIKPEKF